MRWFWREYGDGPADAPFLEFGFGSHLRNYRAFAGKHGFAFAFLSIVGVAAEVISSGIAAGWSGASWSRWAILVARSSTRLV
jgi:hypothetical protein